jgi:hypothetical protein
VVIIDLTLQFALVHRAPNVRGYWFCCGLQSWEFLVT